MEIVWMMGVFQTMKAISVVPLLLLLSGCGPSRESEADLADCHKAAIKTYSGGDGGDPATSTATPPATRGEMGGRSAVLRRDLGELAPEREQKRVLCT